MRVCVSTLTKTWTFYLKWIQLVWLAAARMMKHATLLQVFIHVHVKEGVSLIQGKSSRSVHVWGWRCSTNNNYFSSHVPILTRMTFFCSHHGILSQSCLWPEGHWREDPENGRAESAEQGVQCWRSEAHVIGILCSVCQWASRTSIINIFPLLQLRIVFVPLFILTNTFHVESSSVHCFRMQMCYYLNESLTWPFPAVQKTADQLLARTDNDGNDNSRDKTYWEDDNVI